MIDSGRPSRRRPKSKARNAITYGHVCGPELRPKGSMPIETHQQVGRLIKSVLAATLGHRGIQNCMNMIRGDLDEWVMREFTTDELPQSTFFCLYYGQGEHVSQEAIDKREMVKRVELVQTILASNYPNCAPLRSLLSLAGRTVSLIRNWEVASYAKPDRQNRVVCSQVGT